MKTIGIAAPLKSSGLRRMFEALGEVLCVHFEDRTFGDDAGVDAWILLEADWEMLRYMSNSSRACYAVIRDDLLVPCGESPAIEFSGNDALPPVLTGRSIRSDESAGLKALPQQLGDMTVLASKDGAPLWAIREFQGRHHYVSLPLPELSEREPLFRYFNGKQFIRLLPLIVFLRSLTEDRRWKQPPLQACLMFDDPNLHWRTYGFLDFAEIAAHAQIQNYHVCFATIPQDAWFVHKPTASLFQQYHMQLSLLIHGNDHLTRELARPWSKRQLSGNLRQALRRIREFERRSGIEVSRVMAPPHGACSESTLEEMALLGFEAACISKGSLKRHNSQATWLRTLGMRPSDIIGGLPVFPRFSFSGSCKNNILIAALLNQPIIAVGHHYDVAEGLQLLADLSGFVNSLGNVQWADMRRICRSHYARRFEGDILRVKMFTKRIEICVPEGIDKILADLPWLNGQEFTSLAWRPLSQGSQWISQRPDEPIRAISGQKIEIVTGLPALPFRDAKPVWDRRLWPLVRRQLTEARDRLAPLIKSVPTSSNKRDVS
jgi:hypothetical protein